MKIRSVSIIALAYALTSFGVHATDDPTPVSGANVVAAKAYVDAHDALKQDAIPARATKIDNSDQTFAPSVVTNTSTAGDVGQMAILTGARMSDDDYWWDDYGNRDSIIPTLEVVGSEIERVAGTKQDKIPGYNANNGYQSVLTDTTTDGIVGKMGIITAEENSGDPLSVWEDADDRIPTVGMVADAAQSKIPARATKIDNSDQTFAPSVVTNGTTAGSVGQMAILTQARKTTDDLTLEEYPNNDSLIPTAAAVADDLTHRQFTIPKSGYVSWANSNSNTPYNTNAANVSNSWLSADVAGTGLVTRTSTNGVVGERKIFESTDVSGYSALTGNNKLIADISIPTVGAMMTAMQTKIPASEWESGHGNTIPGVVISTDEDGVTAQRMILDKTDDMLDSSIANLVANGDDGNTAINGTITYDIHDNSVSNTDVNNAVPTTKMTVAIANAAASNVAAVPWNTAEQNATGAYNTTFANSGTNVWPSADANKVVKGETFANAMATKQNKIPAGTAGNLVTYSGTAGTVGSTTPASAPSYNASTGALENGTAIATIAAVDTMQKKIDANDSTTYPNGSVVTYGTTAGTPGQVAIATAPSYNASTGALENGTQIASIAAVNTMQRKRVCVGWATGHENDDDYCYFWDWPD